MYNFNGYPITWLIYGKIHGDLYVDGGHGVDAPPYKEFFTIPNGTKIVWASVFIGIWGGNEYNSGWIEVFLNSSSFGRQEIKGVNDNSLNIFGSTHGCYLVAYNITSYLELNKTIEISVETGGTIDGRIYGIVLVVVFEKPNTVIKFCIGAGNVGLHYLIQGQTYDSFTFTFEDTYLQSDFATATLYVSYLATSLGEADYLYFNDNLLDSNAGDESSGAYFDLDSYNVSLYLDSSNHVEFQRGAEGYIHPILAILTASYKPGLGEDEDYIHYNSEEYSGNSEFNWLYIEIPAIVLITLLVFMFQYRRKKKMIQERA